MAPEVRGEGLHAADARSDRYALCASLSCRGAPPSAFAPWIEEKVRRRSRGGAPLLAAYLERVEGLPGGVGFGPCVAPSGAFRAPSAVSQWVAMPRDSSYSGARVAAPEAPVRPRTRGFRCPRPVVASSRLFSPRRRHCVSTSAALHVHSRSRPSRLVALTLSRSFSIRIDIRS